MTTLCYDVLPSYLICLPVFLLLPLALLRGENGERPPVRLLLGWQVLALFAVAVFRLTGMGTVQDIASAGEFFAWSDISLIPFQWGRENLMGLALNGLLFLPLGVLLPLLWRERATLRHTAAAGVLLSLLIELSQLMTFRATDIDDLIMNTLGTLAGWGLAALLFRRRRPTEGGPKLAPIWSVLALFAVQFFIGTFLQNQFIFWIYDGG